MAVKNRRGRRIACAAVAIIVAVTMMVSPAFAISAGSSRCSTDTLSDIFCLIIGRCEADRESVVQNYFSWLKDILAGFIEETPEETQEVPEEIPDVPAEEPETPDETPETPQIPEEEPEQDTEEETPEEDEPVLTTEQEFAEEVLRLVNVEREKQGLAPLEGSSELNKLADIRAKEQNSAFGHTRPDGTSYYTVLESYSGNYSRSGENVAMGQRTPEEVVQAWMNSSGHRANILNSSYKAMGVGVEKCTVSGYAGYCWAQLFIG